MADFIKNNGDLLKSIIGLIVATIPLVILIVTFLRNHLESTKEPVDSQSLKAIKILRYPIDTEQWEDEHRNAVYTSRIYIVLSVVLYVIIGIFFTINYNAITRNPSINFFYKVLAGLIIPISILVFFVVFGSFVYSKSYKLTFVSAKMARYYIFKDVDIVITANYHYLFSKCLNVLKSMKYQIAEIDEKGGVIQAVTLEWLNEAERINLKIKKIDGSEEMYKVEIEYPSIVVQDDATKSKISNRFIDRLISNPKSVDNKAKSEIVQIKEGES